MKMHHYQFQHLMVGRPKKKVCQLLSTDITVDDDICNDGNLPSSSDVVIVKVFSSLHASNMKERNSEITKVYVVFLGPSLDKFPPSKLPQHCVILKRYRTLFTEGRHKTLQSEIIIMTISTELTKLWESSSIPMKNYEDAGILLKIVSLCGPVQKKRSETEFYFSETT